jgi:hypothetical protein
LIFVLQDIHYTKFGGIYARLLREMQRKEGNGKHYYRNIQKRQTGFERALPHLRHENGEIY